MLIQLFNHCRLRFFLAQGFQVCFSWIDICEMILDHVRW